MKLLRISAITLALFAILPAYSHDASNTSGGDNQVSFTTDGQYRYVVSNGIPVTHGEFPNSHNPNSISAQSYSFRMPLGPQLAANTTQITHAMDFGVALDGIPFDPLTAEYWNRDMSSGWNYTAMNDNSPNLGIDKNDAHVQPNGAYHYHGIPTDLFNTLTHDTTPSNMVLIGYAADGFPMYGLYGYTNANDPTSDLKILTSSYQLKSGTRPSGPGGEYDGQFIEDYHYVDGSGDLDQCNGRSGITPEYPNGTYYYVVTNTYPFVSRCFKGTPDASFTSLKQGRPGGNHGGLQGRPSQGQGQFGPGDRPPPRGNRPPPSY